MSYFKTFFLSSLVITVLLTLLIVLGTPQRAFSQDNNLEACKHLYVGQYFGRYSNGAHFYIINGISSDGYVTYTYRTPVISDGPNSYIGYEETTCAIVYRQAQRFRKKTAENYNYAGSHLNEGIYLQ
jgi:hypothetical protein